MRAVPPPVQAAFDAFPVDARLKLLEIRDLIFVTAAATPDVGPLKEAPRWGEPAYLTAPGVGSSVRLAWKPRTPDKVGVYFICRTSLVDRFRAMFPDEMDYEGDRAILLPVKGKLPTGPLSACIREALTYHVGRPRAAASAGG